MVGSRTLRCPTEDRERLTRPQIRFFLLQNRQGKTRLSKWYVPPPTSPTKYVFFFAVLCWLVGWLVGWLVVLWFDRSHWHSCSSNPEVEKARMEAEVHRLVTARDKKYTNFIEYNQFKLVYRRYAGLFFTIAVDVHDNELCYLETIHLFVELLDSYFSNVCELDIVFHFNKVYAMLDEFLLAGELEETSKREILDRIKLLDKLE